MRNEGVRFLQSQNDFPLMVHLGRKAPSWELNRWGRDALRFSPVENDSFVTRGDRRHYLYKGEKESHRFTILDGSHFEYDMILKREPLSNKLYIRMSNWEEFDFFRQPDSYGPEILQGSYAVYKKDFVVNTRKYNVGTGKICHIHRPKIIDAQGREVWGDVRIEKGLMAIAIPEGWLGEARYPVVVDPVFGLNTIGAYRMKQYLPTIQYNGYLASLEEFYECPEDYDYEIPEIEFYYQGSMVPLGSPSICVNKYFTTEVISGQISIKQYALSRTGGFENFVYQNVGHEWPVIMKNTNNLPGDFYSSNAELAEITVDTTKSGFPEKWVETKGTVNRIEAGQYIWLGFIQRKRIPMPFDYGAEIFEAWEDKSIDNTFSGNPITYFIGKGFNNPNKAWTARVGDPPKHDNVASNLRQDIKCSMYLGITGNYTRTLTQGVKLSDSRKMTAAYKKTLTMNGRNTAALGHGSNYTRKHTETVNGLGLNSRAMAVYRKFADMVTSFDLLSASRDILRNVFETVRSLAMQSRSGESKRTVAETGGAMDGGSSTKRGLFRTMPMTATGSDAVGRAALLLRVLSGKAAVSDAMGHWGDYVRGLLAVAGNVAEMGHEGEYHREAFDTAGALGVPMRNLGVFIRLVTVGFVRDYVLRRFLKSNEELVLKSAVCGELVLESRIH